MRRAIFGSKATAAVTVTLTAESPVIDTLRAYSRRFRNELVENVSTTRSSYFDLITYAPEVKTNQATKVANFSVFGSSTDQNSLTYNGVDVSAPSYGSPRDFPTSIIQEVEVLAVGATAEYAGFQGGIVNIIIESGSNDRRPRLSADVYNLFNAGTYTNLRNNGFDTGDDDFGQPLAIVAPRRAMVGLRFEF